MESPEVPPASESRLLSPLNKGNKVDNECVKEVEGASYLRRPRTPEPPEPWRTPESQAIEKAIQDGTLPMLPYNGPPLKEPLKGYWEFHPNTFMHFRTYHWTDSEWPEKPAELTEEQYETLKRELSDPILMVPPNVTDDAVPEMISALIQQIANGVADGELSL